jgi:hypothetical protein
MAIKIARLPNFNVANGALEGLTVRVGRLFYRCRFAFPHKERRNECQPAGKNCGCGSSSTFEPLDLTPTVATKNDQQLHAH